MISECRNETLIFISNPTTQGLYTFDSENYYYRGKVHNNYVKIINQLFRILSFNSESKEMEIIKETSLEKTGYQSIDMWFNLQCGDIKLNTAPEFLIKRPNNC